MEAWWRVLKESGAVREALEKGITQHQLPREHEYWLNTQSDFDALNGKHNSGLIPLKTGPFGIGSYTHPHFPGMKIEVQRGFSGGYQSTARAPSRHHGGWVDGYDDLNEGSSAKSALHGVMHTAVHNWHRDNLPYDHPDWVAYALGVSPNQVWDEHEALHGEKMETAMAAHPNARRYNWELDPDALEADKYQSHSDPDYVWQPRFMEGI